METGGAGSGRVVRLDTVLNMRDLGGLATCDGRRVTPGRIYRSASLHEMSDADRACLDALGIGTVVDLRSEWEGRHQPIRWSGARIVAAPLAKDAVVASITRRFENGQIPGREFEDWWRLTGLYGALEEHPGSIRTVFETLLSAGPGEAVLYCCRGGKDRTGVVSALVLGALGVRADEIMADFLLSNVLLDTRARAVDLAERFNRELGTSLTAESMFALAGVKEEWLAALLGDLAERHGSIEGYLKGPVGLGAVDLGALRDAYLEPA